MKYQNTLSDNITQCTICPRNCRLKEGQSGFCHIRKNVNGEIVLTSYGYNTGLAIDPIEKKPLYHFYPGSLVLSFGTLGCNMGCDFCQNWRTTKSKDDSASLNYTSPEKIADLAQEYGCKSVAFTYNDPVIFFEYAVDTAKICREKGIKTVAVTAGYINPEPRKEFFKYMDAANIDLKAFNPEFYKKHCLANIEPILDTIKYVKNETDCWLELTTLLIEGENDSEQDLQKECDWILKNLGDEVPIHFSAFHPDYRVTDKSKTKFSTLLKAYSIAKKAGLKNIYTGNTCDIETATTYCSKCKKALIKRDCYHIEEYHLEKSTCAFCGAKCAGVF
ncbi:MAG TPA: AmmeMemoRadiSam system radical SAM enzyme [Candidatus Gastranaerophilaceae bacterium]|nr:AmmeMemoRadiSam system radical SAM enzyme [Candidatus Gastranaerophilaceae bacterium]HPT41879.1 AmmeMemoRadiSam system radical SAM enzyme [Candidatus Gastranaerophilaceae bacterium]